MPVVPINQILDPAFAERYGVAAINIVDDLSLEAVLAAATELESPLIVQTSVKTVKSIGAGPLYSMWRARADEVPVPVSLHLDHCPDREWITTCLEAGWNSVLFDGSRARRRGEHAPDGRGGGRGRAPRRAGRGRDRERRRASRTASAPTMPAAVHPVEVSAKFIEETGVYSFAPAIGTAHGLYKSSPELHPERVTEIVAAASDPDGAARRHRPDARRSSPT